MDWQQAWSLNDKFIWVAGIGCVLGAFLFHRIRGSVLRFRVWRRRRHGLKSEARGFRILRRQGFRVTGIQRSMKMSMTIDGRKVPYDLRPDGVATRRGRQYLVEIKTGPTAGNPLYRETRRQLLEYYHSQPVDGVLFVNADTERVSIIRFKGRNSRGQGSTLRVALAFAGGVMLTLALNHLLRW